MSITSLNYIDPADEARAKLADLADSYRPVLDRMELNILPAPDSSCWADPKFHRMLVDRIHCLSGKKQDADKWEAVKELFREIGRARG